MNFHAFSRFFHVFPGFHGFLGPPKFSQKLHSRVKTEAQEPLPRRVAKTCPKFAFLVQPILEGLTCSGVSSPRPVVLGARPTLKDATFFTLGPSWINGPSSMAEALDTPGIFDEARLRFHT